MDPSVSRRTFLMAASAAVAVGAVGQGAQGQETTGAAVAAAPGDKKSKWRKAIKTSLLPNDMSWEERLTLAKECGFDGVEWDEITTVDDARKIFELSKKLEVPCHGVVFGGWHAPLSDPDSSVTEKGLAGMRNAIDCARALEVETCLLVPAVVRPEVSYADAYKRSQDNVRKLVPYAEENKVIICLENVWNKFLLSPMEFARYIDEIDSPNVKMYFDVANSLVQSFTEHWLEIMGPRIRKIDLKDFSRKQNRFVPLGEGDAPWAKIREHLTKVGYNDFLTSETSAKTKEDLIDSARRMDNVLSD